MSRKRISMVCIVDSVRDMAQFELECDNPHPSIVRHAIEVFLPKHGCRLLGDLPGSCKDERRNHLFECVLGEDVPGFAVWNQQPQSLRITIYDGHTGNRLWHLSYGIADVDPSDDESECRQQ